MMYSFNVFVAQIRNCVACLELTPIPKIMASRFKIPGCLFADYLPAELFHLEIVVFYPVLFQNIV